MKKNYNCLGADKNVWLNTVESNGKDLKKLTSNKSFQILQ